MEDESSQDSGVQYMNLSDNEAMHYRIPASIEDQDYSGIETAPIVLCHQHGVAAERRVAFEAFNTGRRFLVCPKNVSDMKTKMGKKDAEIFKLQEKYKVDELKKSEEKLTQENTQLPLHMGDLKKGHEKLTARRDQLKIQIAELLKSEEKNKQKLKGILDILSE
nr:uncharacterized protein LOC109784028 [Aegilops tauschii subsp. strangulata]